MRRELTCLHGRATAMRLARELKMIGQLHLQVPGRREEVLREIRAVVHKARAFNRDLVRELRRARAGEKTMTNVELRDRLARVRDAALTVTNALSTGDSADAAGTVMLDMVCCPLSEILEELNAAAAGPAGGDFPLQGEPPR